MPPTGGARWVDDSHLYQSARSELTGNPSGNFLLLTTVYTHGDFLIQDDFGERDYFTRLSLSLTRLHDFVKEVQERSPDTLILILPDHKPALSRFFVENGILPESEFSHIGEQSYQFQVQYEPSQDTLGGVFGYIYYPDKELEDEFLRRANSKPFFCVSQILDDIFIHSALPAFEYARRHGLCESYNPPSYRDLVKAYPEWLYALSLFEPG